MHEQRPPCPGEARPSTHANAVVAVIAADDRRLELRRWRRSRGWVAQELEGEGARLVVGAEDAVAAVVDDRDALVRVVNVCKRRAGVGAATTTTIEQIFLTLQLERPRLPLRLAKAIANGAAGLQLPPRRRVHVLRAGIAPSTRRPRADVRRRRVDVPTHVEGVGRRRLPYISDVVQGARGQPRSTQVKAGPIWGAPEAIRRRLRRDKARCYSRKDGRALRKGKRHLPGVACARRASVLRSATPPFRHSRPSAVNACRLAG